MERNTQEQRRYDKEESASIKSETKKFNGMRLAEANKKLRSVLYLKLGNEGKRIFGQKFTKVKVLQISFREFWDSLAIAFVRKTNVTFERHKLLNRKQWDRESLEQFHFCPSWKGKEVRYNRRRRRVDTRHFHKQHGKLRHPKKTANRNPSPTRSTKCSTYRRKGNFKPPKANKQF